MLQYSRLTSKLVRHASISISLLLNYNLTISLLLRIMCLPFLLITDYLSCFFFFRKICYSCCLIYFGSVLTFFSLITNKNRLVSRNYNILLKFNDIFSLCSIPLINNVISSGVSPGQWRKPWTHNSDYLYIRPRWSFSGEAQRPLAQRHVVFPYLRQFQYKLRS